MDSFRLAASSRPSDPTRPQAHWGAAHRREMGGCSTADNNSYPGVAGLGFLAERNSSDTRGIAVDVDRLGDRIVWGMTMDGHEERSTPAWLWTLLVVALVLSAVGAYLARVGQHPAGVPIFVGGIAVLIAFTVLQRRYVVREGGGLPPDRSAPTRPCVEVGNMSAPAYPKVIVPPLWVRILLVVLCGVVVVAAGLVMAAVPGSWAGWAPIVLLALIMSVRLPRAGIVLLDADRLKVRGVFKSLTIPRQAVVKVDMPFIEWTDSKGTWHQTMVFAFSGSGGPDEDVPNSRLRRLVNAEVGSWVSAPKSPLERRCAP
jgi:hypothetical protein